MMNRYEEDSSMTAYRQCMDSISAPDSLKRNLIMKTNFESRTKSKAKRMAMAITMGAAVLLPAADGLVYAATGEGVIHSILVSVNGQPKKIDMEKKVDENGQSYYIGRYSDAGTDVEIAVEDEQSLDEVQFEINEDGASIESSGTVTGIVTED